MLGGGEEASCPDGVLIEDKQKCLQEWTDCLPLRSLLLAACVLSLDWQDERGRRVLGEQGRKLTLESGARVHQRLSASVHLHNPFTQDT